MSSKSYWIKVPGMHNLRASLVTQMVKNLPAMWDTQVWSLGQENPLEKRMATHSSILAWRIPWTEEPGSPWDHKESDMTEQGTLSHFIYNLCLYNLLLSRLKIKQKM